MILPFHPTIHDLLSLMQPIIRFIEDIKELEYNAKYPLITVMKQNYLLTIILEG